MQLTIDLISYFFLATFVLIFISMMDIRWVSKTGAGLVRYSKTNNSNKS